MSVLQWDLPALPTSEREIKKAKMVEDRAGRALLLPTPCKEGKWHFPTFPSVGKGCRRNCALDWTLLNQVISLFWNPSSLSSSLPSGCSSCEEAAMPWRQLVWFARERCCLSTPLGYLELKAIEKSVLSDAGRNAYGKNTSWLTFLLSPKMRCQD